MSVNLTDRIVGVYAPDKPHVRHAIDAVLAEARDEGEKRLLRTIALAMTITFVVALFVYLAGGSVSLLP